MSDNLRPFAFEDLPLNEAGKHIEPKKWGPIYSKPPKPTAKPRGLDPWPSNCASGQKYDYSAAKHRAKLKAEYHRELQPANADKPAIGVRKHGGVNHDRIVRELR